MNTHKNKFIAGVIIAVTISTFLIPAVTFAHDRDEHGWNHGWDRGDIDNPGISCGVDTTSNAVVITPASDTTTPVKSVDWAWTFPFDGASTTYRYLINQTASSTVSGLFRDVTGITVGPRYGRFAHGLHGIRDGVNYIHVQACDSNNALGATVDSAVLLDNTKPVISRVSDITVDPTGTTTYVTYTIPTVTDAIDTPAGFPPSISCSSPDDQAVTLVAGSAQLLHGRHNVICTSTDRAGNVAHASFRITVRASSYDPIITVHYTSPVVADNTYTINVPSDSDAGTVISYTATATDHASTTDLTSSLSCSPASGSTFAANNLTPIICTITQNHHKIFEETVAMVTVGDYTPPDLCTSGCGGTPPPAPSSNGGGGGGGGGFSGYNWSSILGGGAGDGAGAGCPKGYICTPVGNAGGNGGGASFNGIDFSTLFGGAGSGGAGGASSTGTTTFRFLRRLAPGVSGSDVLLLQKFLNAMGFLIAKTGPGSPGHETGVFGPATRAALKKFQEANAKDILTPQQLTQGTGIFGSSTMQYINNLLANLANRKKK